MKTNKDDEMIETLKRVFFMVVFCLMATGLPAYAGIAVVGELSYEHTAKPGELYKGSISIRNNGSEAAEAKIYQTDYLFFADGKNEYGEPGKRERSNASWLSYSPKRVVVAPNETTTINYQVRVPQEKTLVGTYWSMLMVEGIGKESVESSLTKSKKAHMGIQTVLRYGIQIVTQIEDTGISKLTFQEPKFLKENSETFFQVNLVNTGERLLIPEFIGELYRIEGEFVTKVEGMKMRIYPGTSVKQKIKLGTLDDGKYKLLVVADCGESKVFGGVYVFTTRK